MASNPNVVCRVRALGVGLYVTAPGPPPANSAFVGACTLPFHLWARWREAIVEGQLAALRLALAPQPVSVIFGDGRRTGLTGSPA